MDHQLNIFILSFGALQGILLGVLLLRKKVYKAGHFFLLLYLLTLVLQVLMKVANKTWLINYVRKLYFVSYELPFLYGPLLYLFLIQTTGTQKHFRPANLWHFLPFAYFMAADLYDMTFPWYRFVSQQTVSILQLISLAGYHLLCYKTLQKQTNTNRFQRQKRQWLVQLSIASFFVTTFITIALCVMYIFHPRFSEIRYLFAAATFFIYWVSYQAMQRPEFFSLHYSIHNGNTLLLPSVPEHNNQTPKKYNNSTLKEADIARILSDLNRIMQLRRPYLDPELSIDSLAVLAGTNRHSLSQVINECLHKNFYDYLNSYRVRAAQKMLADPGNDHLKIAAIAYDSGFNALSTFNDVFKKLTGQTPSEFRKVAQNGVQKHEV